MADFDTSLSSGHIPVLLNPAWMLVVVRARFSAVDVHLHSVCFTTGRFLFVKHHASLICRNVVLKVGSTLCLEARVRDWCVRGERQCPSLIL